MNILTNSKFSKIYLIQKIILMFYFNLEGNVSSKFLDFYPGKCIIKIFRFLSREMMYNIFFFLHNIFYTIGLTSTLN